MMRWISLIGSSIEFYIISRFSILHSRSNRRSENVFTLFSCLRRVPDFAMILFRSKLLVSVGYLLGWKQQVSVARGQVPRLV